MVNAGGTYSLTGTVRLPDAIQGNFHLLVFTDSAYEQARPIPGGRGIMPYPSLDSDPRLESNDRSGMAWVHEFRDEANNLRSQALPIKLAEAPDLRVTSVSPSAHAITGRGFELSYQVTNSGHVPVPDRQGEWTDQIYLSRDKYLDIRSDHFLMSATHQGALGISQSYVVTQTLTIPRGLLGDYYVFVLTDVAGGSTPQGRVYEASGETNNASPSDQPMIIELPPPADLQVDEIIVPVSAVSGDSLTVEWTVSNHHATETIAGVWADAVYLSSDALWDLGDQLIGRLEQGTLKAIATLEPGDSYTAKLTAGLPPAMPGQYRIIVRTDIFDDIYEGAHDGNNTTASAQSLDVAVKRLHLGIAQDDALSKGEELLYRVETTAGETLEIKLTSSSQSAANEVYVRYEGLPNSINYDAVFEGHLWADQTVRVPTTKQGTYYIMIRGQSEPQPNTPITLLARALPFGIDDAAPDVGGDGRVTMTITGAKFSDRAVVKLVRPQLAEFEPVSYQILSAAKIVAVFDLQDAPHGLYDVQVINPDGAVAVLPYRYLVEASKPLDLTVAVGGPIHPRPGRHRLVRIRHLQPDERQRALRSRRFQRAQCAQSTTRFDSRPSVGIPHEFLRHPQSSKRAVGGGRSRGQLERPADDAGIHLRLRQPRLRRSDLHGGCLSRAAKAARTESQVARRKPVRAGPAGSGLRLQRGRRRHAHDDPGLPRLPAGAGRIDAQPHPGRLQSASLGAEGRRRQRHGLGPGLPGLA